MIKKTKSVKQKNNTFIQIYQGLDSLWYLRIRSKNGRIQTDAEGYASKSNATRAANNLKKVNWKTVEIQYIQPGEI